MLYIITALALFFILQLVMPSSISLMILDPMHPEQLWRLITSMFLHADIEHLFFNAISLFFFAPAVERTIGRKEMYILFFLGGLAGNLLYLALVFAGISPPIPALGASGAIYAIMGAVALFHPDAIVYVYFFPLKMRNAVILWVAINLFYLMDWSSGIGGAAHLGGLAFGYLYAIYLRDHKGMGWQYY